MSEYYLTEVKVLRDGFWVLEDRWLSDGDPTEELRGGTFIQRQHLPMLVISQPTSLDEFTIDTL